MRANMTERENKQDNDVRDIPKWTRRYAQSRTLPMLVLFAIYVVATAVFSGFCYLMFTAGALARGPAVAVAALLLIGGFAGCATAGVIWIMRRMSERLYRSEGAVSPGPSPGENMSWRSPVVALVFTLVFMFCLTASVALAIREVVPMRYMQPISALYIIPALVYMGIIQRGAVSPFMVLWPALYALHAILLVAGAPIHFGAILGMLNIFVPVVGYGVIAALAAHIYSRYALRRLRTLATSPETPDQSIEEGGS
ncbi:MAG: hypothetical protein KAW89_04750 [Armatimonadetes bacterium]|nr:hypothetical protein [Armatimonadota bacterium]